MRSMNEVPERYGVRVRIYMMGNETCEGWVARIPSDTYNTMYEPSDRVFVDDDESYAAYVEEYGPGISHGQLAWGHINDPNNRWRARDALGWDYVYPIIREEDDIDTLVV